MNLVLTAKFPQIGLKYQIYLTKNLYVRQIYSKTVKNDTVIRYKNANMKMKENVYQEVDIAGLSMKTMNMFLQMRI